MLHFCMQIQSFVTLCLLPSPYRIMHMPIKFLIIPGLSCNWLSHASAPFSQFAYTFKHISQSAWISLPISSCTSLYKLIITSWNFHLFHKTAHWREHPSRPPRWFFITSPSLSSTNEKTHDRQYFISVRFWHHPDTIKIYHFLMDVPHSCHSQNHPRKRYAFSNEMTLFFKICPASGGVSFIANDLKFF